MLPSQGAARGGTRGARACAASAAHADARAPSARPPLQLSTRVRCAASPACLALTRRSGALACVHLEVLRAVGPGGATRGPQGHENRWVLGARCQAGSKSRVAPHATSLGPRMRSVRETDWGGLPHAWPRAAKPQRVACVLAVVLGRRWQVLVGGSHRQDGKCDFSTRRAIETMLFGATQPQ